MAYARDLFAAGVFWPDSISSTNARGDFVGKKFAVSPEGQGNSWVDFWQRGLTLNPPSRFGMLNPFPAQSGQKPTHFLGTGFVSIERAEESQPGSDQRAVAHHEFPGGVGSRVFNDEIAWAKFDALAAGARIASGELWGQV